MTIRRRDLLAASAAATLPLPGLAQADQRPAVTVAVQTVSTSGTLEPMREQSNVGFRIMPSFSEPLIGIDWLRTQRPEPMLATSWRRADARTLHLTLRDGVVMHDGRTMEAEDVAFTFSRERMWTGLAADQRGLFASTTAGAAGKTPPPEAVAISRAHYPNFERLEVVDRSTVRFVNAVPDVTLEGRLTRTTGAVFSRAAFAAAPTWLDWARQPVGTGPYRVARYRPNQDLLLEAHDRHWMGRPPLKSIRLVEVPDVAARVAGLLAGDWDFACDLPPDQIAGIERSPRHHVVGGPINNIRLIVWDKTHPVLANPLVRRAMSHAIDRQAIVDSLWAGRTAVPRGLQWEVYGDMHLADWEAPRFDPAEVRRLLREAGYRGEPIPYQLLNNYYTGQVASAQILQEGWRQAGLNVQIEMKENWGQILGRFPGRGLCDNSNTATFGDPVAAHSVYGPGGQTWASGQWENPEAPRLLDALQVETDVERRRALFRRLLALTEREDPAYTVLFQTAVFIGKRRDLPWQPAKSFVMDFTARNWAA
ncbi:ABC transporter substrate-binding protein [Paracraurococcus ruber]|uniref:ABC transporter substrate-binding protein n=1 Tax=Paracraurococcus ruber TaxID=77675 RepID=A0ABS1CVY0_9PROT|nr:ABC transporter substrate-binding protein [Paracraurococcus ruber]MBK1658676.1 ABC transporter substrate-binding protein [Paracraurococcus ruber]TDG31256.1 ABC transporter substrate-binding protein [Paracraurococcus ruber]